METNFMCTHTHTGAIYVVDELDFETKQNYDLIVRATDSVSGVSAEVPVSIVVTDINDSPPTLPLDNYEITVSESLPFGSSILQVTAQDNDIGKGKVLIILLHFFLLSFVIYFITIIIPVKKLCMSMHLLRTMMLLISACCKWKNILINERKKFSCMF